MELKLKELKQIGYTQSNALSLAVELIKKHCKHQSKNEILNLLIQIKNNPEQFQINPIYEKLANCFSTEKNVSKTQFHELETAIKPLKIYGKKDMEASAIKQMEIALSLPISISGAMLPDAHTGFGVPIGGVLATKNNYIIPYAVGVDIGCRMALSIFEANDQFINKNHFLLTQSLKEKTHFGMEGGVEKILDHEIMDRREFNEFTFLKKLKNKAYKQLGSSGSGNHFVEFGWVELNENNPLNLPAKKYLALLSHSGSRGLGASIAQYFIKSAMEVCQLPKHAKSLAWLDLNTDLGKEYWQLMNFAGDYAIACHDNIHTALGKAIGLKSIAKIENHHNFAWQETDLNGNEMMVHRKGATPAQKGMLGIIPGSMSAPAFLVSGTGNSSSLNSASHGAGRAMSRQEAKRNFTPSALNKLLAQEKITLIGGSVEENPFAYKNIEAVMGYQKDLVSAFGKFYPKVVRMCRE